MLILHTLLTLLNSNPTCFALFGFLGKLRPSEVESSTLEPLEVGDVLVRVLRVHVDALHVQRAVLALRQSQLNASFNLQTD